MRFKTTFNGQVIILTFSEDFSRATIDEGETKDISWRVRENGRRLLRIGDRIFKIDDIEKDGRNVTFTLNGSRHQAEVKNEQDLLLEHMGFRTDATIAAGKVDAPMPGKILDILARENDRVELGQPVAILEAMKMENELKATANGTVVAVHVTVGDSVEKNQPLLEIKPGG